jgi:spermidine synthase
MSIVYREKDQTLFRDYELLPEGKLVSFKTKRATVDIVETKEYASMFFLDGVLQCSIADEYIYHEYLVHIPMSYAQQMKSVCIFGGGDGCAAREILKWKDVCAVDLYDWDAQLVDYFRNHGKLWNQGSLKNPNVFYQDVDITTLFTNSETERYDVIIIDLLDPEYRDVSDSNGFWAKLLKLASNWKTKGGTIVINGGGISPWQNESFVLLKNLCKTVFTGFHVVPYKVFVPSFGREWGFLMITERISPCNQFPPFLRRVDQYTHGTIHLWEPDFKIER